MSAWPEITTAKSENRHEIKLSGAAISKRISETGLDNTVFQLTGINLLNISDTCLTTIPDDIKRLVNLQSLLLYGNKLQEFNENITSLPKLKVLDLSRNQLTAIPESLNKMKELTSINFSSNQIDSMPKFGDFPNLIIVDCSNNKLTSFLDIENANLPHLTDIKIQGNAIESIPSYVTRLPSLKNFDVGENQLKTVPGEIASLTKLKELNLKGNKLSDKRLMKLVDQCRTKQVVDYIREHCPKSDQTQQPSGKGNKGKKGKKQEEPEPEETVCDLCHSMKILYVEDNIPNVKIDESQVGSVRPYILCCIIQDLKFTEALFKKFIQMQTKLHDSVCDKRNVGTIATHDLKKIPPGDLLYTAKVPSRLTLTPLSRLRPCTGEQLFQQLTAEAEALRKEKKRNVYSGIHKLTLNPLSRLRPWSGEQLTAMAEALRKEKKRNVYSGIHKYLYLLEGKPKYPCLLNSAGKVISFPPITNAEDTKMSHESTSMFVEVTSHASLGACKTIINKLLQECLLLGIGDHAEESFHSLTVQQVKVVDLEGNLKSVYPSRTDCVYDDPNIKVIRLPKK